MVTTNFPSVLETCMPRESIIKGTFNPEIFTAALSPVVKFYQGEKTNIDAVYTDAKLFFTQGTYLTDGMKTTLRNVFARLSGDNGAPSVQRLETAFGGGKTHTLIACVHIAYSGKELKTLLENVFDSASMLPEPKTIKVVGIAGDELPVVKPIGNKLIPFTLWGEIAYQIGGTNLYSKVKSEAESYASPGTHFFDEIFTGNKVLILIDEIAQYAARLEVSQPGRGLNSVTAFLFALCNYAQAHSNIAAVITLASSVNAFSQATDELKRALQDISNGQVTDAMAEDIVTQSTRELMDVNVRVALSVTPVQEGVTFVGYVVKTKTDIRMVSSYHQASEIKDLDKDGTLSDEDIQSGLLELRKQVNDEVGVLHIIRKSKEYNEQFAALHRLLIKRVAVEVLKTAFADSNNDVPTIIRSLQDGDVSLDGIRIYIPSKDFKNQESKLLFDVIEENGNLYVKGTKLLTHSIADYLERTVNGMKKHISGITVDRLIKSINDSIGVDKKKMRWF